MNLASAGYREWTGTRCSPWWGTWAIMRAGLGTVLRRRVFWILIGLGLTWVWKRESARLV